MVSSLELLILIIVIGFGLLVLAFFFFRFWILFKRLTKGVGEKDLKKVLGGILTTEIKNKESLEKLDKEIQKLGEEGRLHVQKLALVRFNPFRDTGGDHSFSLAILDGVDSGVIITGLHTRERTRLYIKGVKTGKSDLELSEEEKKVLAKAQKS